jgi:hypothetical protein
MTLILDGYDVAQTRQVRQRLWLRPERGNVPVVTIDDKDHHHARWGAANCSEWRDHLRQPILDRNANAADLDENVVTLRY